MPYIYEDVQVTEKNLVGFECDKCHSTYDDADFVEMQERLEWRTRAGYGSIWGDGNFVQVVICQHCAHDLFCDIATITE